MLSTIIGVLVAGVAVVFAFQNNDIVTVKFFENYFTGSVALIIISSLIIGLLIGMIIFVPRIISSSWRARNLFKENERLKNRLNEAPIQYEAPGLGQEGEGHIEIN